LRAELSRWKQKHDVARQKRKRDMSAWYWRRRFDPNPHDGDWEFLCYGKPDVFYLQREYIEIKSR
jgi:hypothetical protein